MQLWEGQQVADDTQHESALDAAIRYASIGWPVFPCGADKKPLIKEWQIKASVDRDTIGHWWQRWPEAHIGVATGLARLCVLDLDLKPSEKKDGVVAFGRLVEQNGGQHGCGLIASTPRGGRHYVYLAPEQKVTTCADVLPGSGIDVRADGGYIVVPSPASPGRAWVQGDPFAVREGGTLDVGPMPPWVLALVAGGHRGDSKGTESGRVMPLDARQVAAIRRALAHIDNTPHDTWIKVGMALKSTGARQQAFDLWVEWSRATAVPGVDHVKFDAKEQAYRWDHIHEYRMDGSEITLGTLFHMAKEGGYVPVLEDELAAESVAAEPVDAQRSAAVEPSVTMPFPMHLIGGDDLVSAITSWIYRTALQPQPALALGATLATLGAVLGRRVETSTGLRSNLLVLAVADSGSGKGHAPKCIRRLLVAANLLHLMGPSLFASGSAVRTALQCQLSQIAFVDEFGRYLHGITDQHAPAHLRGIADKLMVTFSVADTTWEGEARADAKAHPPTPLHEPNLCLVGMTTYETLFDSLKSAQVMDGFLNRILAFFGQNDPPHVHHDDVCAAPPAGLVERIAELSQATAPPVGAIEHMGGFARRLEDTRAARLWVAGRDTVVRERRLALAAQQSPYGPLWVRFIEHCRKLALVRTLAEDPSATTVDVPALEWAAELVTWCFERFQSETGDRVADTPHEAAVKRLWRTIRAAGKDGMTGSELARKTQWCRRQDRRDLLATLIESGQLGSREFPTKTKPTTRYYCLSDGAL